MLIVFCFLYLTYSPWPVAGAIWASKRNPDTDKLREFAESGYGRESKVAIISLVLGDRRVSFRDSSGKRTSRTSSRTTVSGASQSGPWQSVECKRDEISSASTNYA